MTEPEEADPKIFDAYPDLKRVLDQHPKARKHVLENLAKINGADRYSQRTYAVEISESSLKDLEILENLELVGDVIITAGEFHFTTFMGDSDYAKGAVKTDRFHKYNSLGDKCISNFERKLSGNYIATAHCQDYWDGKKDPVS